MVVELRELVYDEDGNVLSEADHGVLSLVQVWQGVRVLEWTACPLRTSLEY